MSVKVTHAKAGARSVRKPAVLPRARSAVAHLHDDLPPERLLRWPEVERITGMTKSIAYRMMAVGEFPSSIPLSNGRAVAWIFSEINDFVRQTIESARSPNPPKRSWHAGPGRGKKGPMKPREERGKVA